jgi:hypothetical protein
MLMEKKLNIFAEHISFSDYSVLKRSCENPGLCLVTRRSVNLSHIFHFFIFIFKNFYILVTS